MPEIAPAAFYTLRSATAADYDFLYALHVATMHDYVAATWGWDDAVQQAMFRERFTPEPRQIVLVAGDPVGVIQAARREHDCYVAEIEIHPDQQGQGLGTALLRAVLAQAAQDQVPTRLQVLRSNPAQHLYQRLGFVQEGETATHLLLVAAPTSRKEKD